MKILNDIRDALAGNVIIPARPPRPNDNGNYDNGNDDNGNDDNGNGDNGNDDNGDDDNGNDDNGDYDNGNDDNGNDDNGNDDKGDDKTSFIDLSWINDLQLYKKIASEVFNRYNVDKDSFELITLRTFIENIINECVKNKKRCTRRI